MNWASHDTTTSTEKWLKMRTTHSATTNATTLRAPIWNANWESFPFVAVARLAQRLLITLIIAQQCLCMSLLCHSVFIRLIYFVFCLCASRRRDTAGLTANKRTGLFIKNRVVKGRDLTSLNVHPSASSSIDDAQQHASSSSKLISFYLSLLLYKVVEE